MAINTELTQRIDALETAVASLARLEFGDVAGHAFHGNQYTGAPEGATDAQLRAAHNMAKQQASTGENFQSPHGVSKDQHFGGHVVEHGGLHGSSQVDKKGNTVSSSMYLGNGKDVVTTGGARWRAEMAGDKANAERIWNNRDLISAGMVDKLGPQGAFNGSRINVTFNPDNSATVGDYDYHRWEFQIPKAR